MQLPTLLGTIVKSGKITVSANDVEAIQISAENNNIDLKIKDKEIELTFFNCHIPLYL